MIENWITIGGVRIRYVDSGGEGIPMFLLSGIGGSLEFWSNQFGALGESLRLIAWDYPGHGLSDGDGLPHDPDRYATFALDVMNTLGLERVVAVGNSLGGAIALRMAGLAPDRIAGLVLASPAMMGPEVFLPFRLMALPLLGELMNKPGKLSVEQQIAALFHDPASATVALRRVIWRNVHKDGASRTLLATMRLTLWIGGVRKRYWARSRALLAATTCPILFIHGRQDVVLPVQQSIDCAGLNPRAEVKLIEDCGHTPQIEIPERFNEELLAFARKVDGGLEVSQ